MADDLKSGAGTGGPKKETTKDVEFAKGGDTPMFGQQNSDEQKPQTTAHDTSPTTGTGDKFASGGSGKMFGYRPSTPAQAGITSPS